MSVGFWDGDYVSQLPYVWCLYCGECYVISLYFLRCSVGVSVCLVYCVFVNCLVRQFAICFGVVAILLLNIMDVFSVGGAALLDRPCMVFQ